MSDSRKTAPGLLRGVVLMMCGCALLTFNDSLMKSLANSYPIGQTLFVRGVFILVPIAWLAHRQGGLHTLRATHVPGQLLRGVFLALGTFCFITSLGYLPLADAIALTFAGPLILTAVAPWLLGEAVGWRRRSAVALGFVGVLIMLAPGAEGMRWAALLPLGAAMFETARDIATRRMVATESSISMVAWSTGFVTLCGLATVGLGWLPMKTLDIAVLALAGLVMGIAMFLMTEAFRFAQASLVAPFRYSSVLWGMLFGWILFGDQPSANMLVGAFIVAASGIYILRRTHGSPTD